MRTRRLFLRSGAALQIAAGAVALAALIGAGLAALKSSSSSTRALVHAIPAVSTVTLIDPLTNQELGVALARVGLDAPALAAAGLDGTQATSLVSRARTYLADHIQSLRDADSAYDGAKASVDQLRRLVQSGTSSEQDRSNYTAALSTLSAAAATRQSALDDFLAAAANTGAQGGLTAAQASTLSTIHANAPWALPTQYLALSRSQSDWVALKEALANDRISVARSEDPDAANHQLLQDAQADPAAAAAAQGLAALNDVRTAWDSAVGQ